MPTAIGSHGLGEIGENGMRLIDYIVTDNMIDRDTWYPHRTIQKYTWKSPDGITRNQIEHILISKRRKLSFEVVRGYHGAD